MSGQGMVDRVARAIAPLAWSAVGLGDTSAHKNRRTASLKHARAAIEAMREPTMEMCFAGNALGDKHGVEISERYREMIDAALSEND